MSCVIETVRLANRRNVPVVLNPSPFREGFPWTLLRIDTLVANAGEAAALLEERIDKIATRLSAWRRSLAQRHIKCLIITRGAEPTLCITAQDYFVVPSLRVKPVDTVGAGDAFTGTFAAVRARGGDLPTAIRYANCAGALTTLKPGAQESIPNLAATEKALRAAG